MQENEFEKQVHEKMGELRLDPTDAVWKNVEGRLRKQKKRRRFLIWLPLALVGLFLGGYFTSPFLFPGHTKRQLSVAKENNSNFINRAGKAQYSRDTPGDPNPADPKNNHSSPITSTATHVIDGKKAGRPDPLAASGSTTTKTGLSQNIKRMPEKREPRIAAETYKQTVKLTNADLGKTRAVSPPVHTRRETSGQTREEDAAKLARSEQANPRSNDAAGNPATLPELPGELQPANVRAEHVVDHSVNTSLIRARLDGLSRKSAIKLHRKKTWQIGVAFEAGRSSIDNGPLNSLFRASDPLSYSSVSAPNSNPNGNSNASAAVPPGPLKSGPGFSAGIYLKKQLTPAVALTLGLNYALYSSSYLVGQHIDSVFIPQANNSSQDQFSGLFRTGYNSKYVNRYHFIELPVSLQANVLGKRQTRLLWDVGFSVSRLLSTNALHYDDQARIFYKDNSLFNKTQFNLVTGLPVQFHALNKFSFQVGPQFQYGFTKLSDATGNGNHFIILGLKAGVLMRK